jgi:hypothetical protein
MTIRKTLTRSFAAFGAVAAILRVAGFVQDVRSFDGTSGGYEPPYTDVVGDPIDWREAQTTDSGMLRPGRVLDTHLDCTTGTSTSGVTAMPMPRARQTSMNPPMTLLVPS